MRRLSRNITILLLCATFAALPLLNGCSSAGKRQEDNPELILEQARAAYFKGEYQQVFQMLFPLAAAGNDQAQYTLGYLYHYGLGVEKNDQQAMQWIQRSAAKGNKKAIEALK